MREVSVASTLTAALCDVCVCTSGDVHPRNKSYVGERLSLLLRHNLYAQHVESEAPLLITATALLSSNSSFHLTLHYSDDERSGGMFALPTPGCYNASKNARDCCVQTGTNEYRGLVWYTYAVNGKTHTVNSVVNIDQARRTITTTQQPDVMPVAGQPVTVSYAYVDWPGCALYNQYRLPALPFQMNVTVQGAQRLTISNLFSSNMVLQRRQPTTLWGTGTPGARVAVKATGLPGAAGVVGPDGEWRVVLQAAEVATGVIIAVTDGTTPITLRNVAFGDVYLCSGQSNMEIVLNYTFGGAEAIAAAANYTNIRLYSIPPQWSQAPLTQSNPAYPIGWVLPSADTLQNPTDPTDVWSYFSAVCWYTGRDIYDSLNGTVPIGLLQSSVGGTCIAAWTSYATNVQCGEIIQPPIGGFDDAPRNQPSFLYNAMIHPLRYADVRFTAVLWYQAEEDNYAIDRYYCAFPNMINDWRTQLRQAELPFYFVQLAPYTWADSTIPPQLRDAQLSGLELEWTGVANTIDLGDLEAPASVGNIHPRNKSYVGERLARWVRRDIYGQQVMVAGPSATAATASIEAVNSTVSSLVISISYLDDASSDNLFAFPTPDCINATSYGCCTIDDSNPNARVVSNGLLHYEYQGPNGAVLSGTGAVNVNWYNYKTLAMKVYADYLPKAGDWVVVKYAWQAFPGCALYNGDRLPALPFRVNITVSSVASTGAIVHADSTAALHINNVFSSNMVLQRAPQQAVMWGTGEPGRTVLVAVDGAEPVKGVVSGDGSWRVELLAHRASTGHTVIVTDGNSTITLSNVAFGDVYLCSGQSNMMIVLNYSFGGVEATAAAGKYPNIRLFNIPMQYDTVPRNETGVSFSPDSWVLPSADTLQNTQNWQDVWSYFSATCYWTGMHLYDSLNGTVPIGLVHSSWGGTCIQAWTSADSNDKCGPLIIPPFNNTQNQPSVLYNAQIHPLLPMRLTAVLWYQGESDDFDIERYACSFPNMIQDWRTKFNYSNLPFYFALLAPYTVEADAFVSLRQSQVRALQLPHVGVANTIDLGDVGGWMGEVHPRNKSYVGERFARWLRRDIYGQRVAVSGPQPRTANARISNQQLTVNISFTTGSSFGLFALPTPDCIHATRYNCCTITGNQVDSGLLEVEYSVAGVNYAASGVVTINDELRVLSLVVNGAVLPSVRDWVNVSYAWQGFPGCALYNDARLPALPFRMEVMVNHGMPTVATDADAALRLNNLFSSNMVLQRTQQAAMWGYGVADSTITVRLDGASVATSIVSNNGTWSVQLPATDASFNHTITVSDGNRTVTLSNVAFGDVYLCSGQSNMQINLNYSFGGPEAIASAANYPNIRLFSMFQSSSTTPLNESTGLTYSPNSWVLPSSSTLQPNSWTDVWSYFSATCYWTAKYVSDSLNNTIPIGLVQSAFGGTIVEAWTSPDTNTKCGPITLPPNSTVPQDQPSSVFNSMINPLLPMRFRAVLWYQGESNWYNTDRYACAFPNMINDWRTKFGYAASVLPFYFVILSPYAGCDPLLRQAQLAAWPAENVGVASAIDLGDKYGSWFDIHPRNKSFVGERLARWVRRDIYQQQQQVFALGPEPIRAANDINVTVQSNGSSSNVSTVIVVVTYHSTESNYGMYTLPSPDCTTCCTGGAGLLWVRINDTAAQTVATYYPSVVIDPAAHTLTTTFVMQGVPSINSTATIGLQAEDWPQCILYNRHQLPALPFIITVPVYSGGGDGGGGDDDSGSSHVALWAGIIAASLVAVIVAAWLLIRQRKRARSSSSGAEADATGYRDIDERRSNLLSDDSNSSAH